MKKKILLITLKNLFVSKSIFFKEAYWLNKNQIVINKVKKSNYATKTSNMVQKSWTWLCVL